ncbi:MAG: hypothetical protein CMM47_10565 [Rhodospirillaceae bacterium]|nr:hypothetical protein [Rhodospirillaceae bacterium]
MTMHPASTWAWRLRSEKTQILITTGTIKYLGELYAVSAGITLLGKQTVLLFQISRNGERKM